MEDHSYDDTEHTPEPTPFRPPPPTNHPLPRSPPREAANNSSLLQQNLFSFSLDESLDEAEVSLPSLNLEPPSPISKPAESLFSGESYRSRQHAPSTISRASSGRQPPIFEVHVDNQDNQDNDTFFECLDSQSLAQRARRSLSYTPDAKAKTKPRQPTEEDISSAGGEPQNPSSDDVARVHDDALHALMTLKEELLKEKKKNHVSELEKQNVTQERDGLKKLLEDQGNASFQLEGKNSALKQLEEEKKNLDDKARAAAREKKEYMHRKLAADNRQKELKLQLDQTQEDLEKAIAAKEELASDLGRSQNENLQLQNQNEELAQQIASKESDDDSIRNKLRSELELKNQEANESKRALDEFKQESQKEGEKLKEENEFCQKEIERLKTALREANKAMRSGISPNGQPSIRSPPSSSRTRTPAGFNSSVRFQTEQTDPSSSAVVTLDSSIADRLARMRDSAERAHLIKSHKRDLSRLKQDKEAEMKKLANSHEEAMRKALKHADAKMKTKLEELKKIMAEEYEEKLDELETRHKQILAEMEKELGRRQEAADESICAAKSKVTSTTQQCEFEVARRESLERSLKQLNRQAEQEKKELIIRHEEELEKRRMNWEMEKETMLTVIQSDCNSAFDHRRGNIARQSPSRSPTTVDSEYFSKMTVDTSRSEPSPARSATMISPAYSDIDSVLRETEDLIQSIM